MQRFTIQETYLYVDVYNRFTKLENKNIGACELQCPKT